MKVICVSLAVLALIYCAEAQNKQKWLPLLCTEGHYSPDQKIMSSLATCSDPTIYGTEPGKLNPQCGFYCTAEQFGLLNNKRQVKQQIYDDWVDSSFPAQYNRAAKAHFKDCFTKFPIDYTEKDCKSAHEFLGCTWNVVPKMPC